MVSCLPPPPHHYILHLVHVLHLMQAFYFLGLSVGLEYIHFVDITIFITPSFVLCWGWVMEKTHEKNLHIVIIYLH